MAHDYAKKPRAKTAAKKPPAKPRARSRKPAPPAKAAVPGWVWLFVGTAVGAFVMFLVRLAEVDTSSLDHSVLDKKVREAKIQEAARPVPKPVAARQPAQKPAKTTPPAVKVKPAKPVEAKAKAEPEKPRFDFYHMLKENEVPVEREGEQQGVAAKPKPQRTFILQVASFKTPEDAEQLKVELILMNLEARSEKVTVRNGEVWHRVLAGPFKSRSKLAKARSTLISNGHQALVMEYKEK